MYTRKPTSGTCVCNAETQAFMCVHMWAYTHMQIPKQAQIHENTPAHAPHMCGGKGDRGATEQSAFFGLVSIHSFTPQLLLKVARGRPGQDSEDTAGPGGPARGGCGPVGAGGFSLCAVRSLGTRSRMERERKNQDLDGVRVGWGLVPAPEAGMRCG